MQGQSFLILNNKGTPVNHGVILEQITPERYLCYFAAKPAMSRVVRLEEIEGYNLFPNDDALNVFIAALTKQTVPPEGAVTQPSKDPDTPDGTTPPDLSPSGGPQSNKKTGKKIVKKAPKKKRTKIKRSKGNGKG